MLLQREFQTILKNQASNAKIFESLFRKLNKEIRTVHINSQFPLQNFQMTDLRFQIPM